MMIPVFCLFAIAFGIKIRHREASKTLASHYHSTESDTSFVRPLEFKHRLRVCNAYGSSMNIFRAKVKLTEPEMEYKECRQFAIQLLTGDKLEFHIGDSNGGTFAVASMPENDAVLLLVISRHDSESSAVSFESHIFANLADAQVAVIDTYKGKNGGVIRIQDHDQINSSRSEELRYDSVVALNPGFFDCVLYGKDGIEKKKVPLVALNREAYVVLRVGVEHQLVGHGLPEEIIVFPHSPEDLLPASAYQVSMTLLLVMLFLWN